MSQWKLVKIQILSNWQLQGKTNKFKRDPLSLLINKLKMKINRFLKIWFQLLKLSTKSQKKLPLKKIKAKNPKNQQKARKNQKDYHQVVKYLQIMWDKTEKKNIKLIFQKKKIHKFKKNQILILVKKISKTKIKNFHK